jgi:Glyoxalase/Bleomycin resistance protein/Dioxygenase superfamily
LTINSRFGIVAATMPRIDHVAVETDDPAATAGFYERFFGARIVKREGHPAEEQEELKRHLDEAGIEWEERDHEIAVGVFFRDPDGRQLEAIVYAGVE